MDAQRLELLRCRQGPVEHELCSCCGGRACACACYIAGKTPCLLAPARSTTVSTLQTTARKRIRAHPAVHAGPATCTPCLETRASIAPTWLQRTASADSIDAKRGAGTSSALIARTTSSTMNIINVQAPATCWRALRQVRQQAGALLLAAKCVDGVHHERALHAAQAAQRAVPALQLLQRQGILVYN